DRGVVVAGDVREPRGCEGRPQLLEFSRREVDGCEHVADGLCRSHAGASRHRSSLQLNFGEYPSTRLAFSLENRLSCVPSALVSLLVGWKRSMRALVEVHMTVSSAARMNRSYPGWECSDASTTP